MAYLRQRYAEREKKLVESCFIFKNVANFVTAIYIKEVTDF